MEQMRQEIHHRVLNLFTMLNYLLSDEPFKKKEHKECQQLLKAATMLIEHEDVFLQKSPQLFLQQTDIKSILEIILGGIASIATEKNIRVVSPTESISLNVDRYYIDKGLRLLLELLSESSRLIDCKIDPIKKQLVIRHDQKKIFSNIPNKAPLRGTSSEISQFLCFQILKICNLEIEEDENRITLTFTD